MSSSEDNECDEPILTSPEIQEAARAVIENSLPLKSKEKYLKYYENFLQWKNERKSKSFSENVFLAYFGELAKQVKPTTLWVIYSMLKCTVLMKHNINLKQYAKLTSMLKRQSDGYKCKKSKVFTASDVKTFLFEAPDIVYLDLKVILIFGIFGACRCNEITNITTKDVENHDGVIIVTLRDTKTKIKRTFVIRDESAAIVQKYIALRPPDIKTNRFFLNYKNNKCTKQVIGRHKIAAMPKAIATYLNLPNPEYYTGHCFRRSSATLLADTDLFQPVQFQPEIEREPSPSVTSQSVQSPEFVHLVKPDPSLGSSAGSPSHDESPFYQEYNETDRPQESNNSRKQEREEELHKLRVAERMWLLKTLRERHATAKLEREKANIDREKAKLEREKARYERDAALLYHKKVKLELNGAMDGPEEIKTNYDK